MRAQEELVGKSARPEGLLAGLGNIALQHPLLETRPSLEGLAAARVVEPPGAVFVGLGVCSRGALSVSLPVDVLALLAPAEEVRRALGADRLLVLVADAHAAAAGLCARAVRAYSDDVVEKITRAGAALGLRSLEVLHASALHVTPSWRRAFAALERRTASSTSGYFLRQTADVAALQERFGGLMKVGWSLGGGVATTRRDEVAFDRFFRAHVNDHVGFVYGKAGRVLDDTRRKAPPYVTLDRARRVCLEPDEDVSRKLARADRSQTTATVQGARRYYRALCASVARLSGPLSGTVEERLQTLIGRVLA